MYILNKKEFKIGRAPSNDLIIENEPKISREHCVITFDSESFELTITDNNSANGTYVNDEKITKPFILEIGDIIKLGNKQFIIEVKNDNWILSPFTFKSSSFENNRKTTKKSGNLLVISIVSIVIILIIVGAVILNKRQNYEKNIKDDYNYLYSIKDTKNPKKVLRLADIYISQYPASPYLSEAKKIRKAAVANIKKLKNIADEYNALLKELVPMEDNPSNSISKLNQFIQNHPNAPQKDEILQTLKRLHKLNDLKQTAKYTLLIENAESFIKSGNFSETALAIKKLQDEYSTVMNKVRFADLKRKFLEKSETDFNSLIKEGCQLLAENKINDCISLYQANLLRFKNTRYYYELNTKMQNAKALIDEPAITTNNISEQDKREVDRALSSFKYHCETFDIRAAYNDYVKIKDYFAKSEQKKNLPNEIKDIDWIFSLNTVINKTIKKINSKDINSTIIKSTDNTIGMPVKATDNNVQIESADKTKTLVSWMKIAPDDLFVLLGKGSDTLSELYSIIAYGQFLGYKNELDKLLYLITSRFPDEKNNVYKLLAEIRNDTKDTTYIYENSKWKAIGMPTPPKNISEKELNSQLNKFYKDLQQTSKLTDVFYEYWGFSEKYNTIFPKEIKESREKVLNILTEKYNGLKETGIKNSKGVDLAQLKKLKKELNQKRAAALKIIFDKKIYPDEDHGAVGQPIVDKAVKKVTDLWKTKGKLKLKKSIVEKLKEVYELLIFLNPKLPSIEDELSLLQTSPDNKYVLQSFCLNSSEKNLYNDNREIEEFNKEEAIKFMSSEEYEVLRLTNEYREMMGRRRLKCNQKLTTAARKHSEYMKSINKLIHEEDNPARRFPSQRIKAEGYSPNAAGENCAMGTLTPASAVAGWQNSSGHHRSLLRKEFYDLGVGKAGIFWTQDFGSQ